eukprot:365810-Chlamydomonas_euryale.AAC.21
MSACPVFLLYTYADALFLAPQQVDPGHSPSPRASHTGVRPTARGIVQTQRAAKAFPADDKRTFLEWTQHGIEVRLTCGC